MSLSPKPAAIAAALALAAAGGGTAVLATSAGASPVAPATSASHASGQTGTGSVTITGPKGKTHTRTVPVSCKVVKGRYEMLAGKPHAKKGSDLRLTVKDYTGAGNATASVLIIRHSHGDFSGHRYAKVPVTLTSDGGSFTYSKTLSGKKDSALKGKTISVSASWTCSA
jgi:hypothetical protein